MSDPARDSGSIKKPTDSYSLKLWTDISRGRYSSILFNKNWNNKITEEQIPRINILYVETRLIYSL